MKKHQTRYLLIVVIGGLLFLIPAVAFYNHAVLAYPTEDLKRMLSGNWIEHYTTLLLTRSWSVIVWPLSIVLAWVVANEKDRGRIRWPIWTTLFPPLFLILLFLPYTSFRREVVNS